MAFIRGARQAQVRYVTLDGRSYLRSNTYLKAIEAELALYPNFARTSQKFLVNLEHASTIAIDPKHRGHLIGFHGIEEQALISDRKRRDGLYALVDKAAEQWGVTALAFGGSPNAITSDFLYLDLAERLDLEAQPLRLYGHVDYDPAGIIRVAFPFKAHLEALGATVESLYLINQPSNYPPDEPRLMRVPIEPDTQYFKDWIEKGYGIRDGRTYYGLIADGMLPGQASEIFHREASPHFWALPPSTLMTDQLLKPGDMAPASGRYAIIDPDGTDTGVERTAIKGNTLPPTPRPGQRYHLVDPTRTQPPNS